MLFIVHTHRGEYTHTRTFTHTRAVFLKETLKYDQEKPELNHKTGNYWSCFTSCATTENDEVKYISI